MSRFWNSILLGATLLAPVAVTSTAFAADDSRTARTYHDKAHNDDHQWNDREDRAYQIWVRDNHRKTGDFAKLKARDQEAYWAWRHNHSDAELKIDIR